MQKYGIAREFFLASLVGAISAGLVFGNRPVDVQWWEHILAGAFLMGTMSVVLRSPPGGMLTVIGAFLVTIFIGGSDPHIARRLSWLEYVPFLFALQFWVWGLFELFRHRHRMNTDPEYAEEFYEWQRRNRGESP